MKHNALLLVFFLNLSFINVYAQSMAVNQLDGNQSTYNLTTVLNMTFTSGNFNVKAQDITNSFTLLNFKNLKFTPGLYTSNRGETNEDLFRVFPNPVKNNLTVNLNGAIAQDALLRIYSIEGKLMTFQTISNPSTILNLSKLAAGFYYCNYFNGSKTKTIKIVKE